MNNLIEEIANIVKLPFNEITNDYKIVAISNKILYVSNYIKIMDYSKENIVIKVQKGKFLKITGSLMQICQMNIKELVIKGKISLIDFGEDNEKNK